MSITKICPQCEKPFSIPPCRENKYNFCSMECKRANTPKRNCKKCGKEFSTKLSKIKSGRGSYCSKECWSTRGNAKEIPCIVCSKPIRVTDNGKQIYCSYECRNIGMLLTDPYHICKHCGKRFIDRKHRDREYCSQQCFGKSIQRPDSFLCAHCGKECFAPTWIAQKQRYCSKECFYKSTARTSIEIIVSKMLDELGHEFIEQCGIGMYTCDFYLPKYRLVIEADGVYWHSKPKTIKNDKAKNTYLTRRDYKLLRLPEEKINKHPDWCKEQITNIVNV